MKISIQRIKILSLHPSFCRKSLVQAILIAFYIAYLRFDCSAAKQLPVAVHTGSKLKLKLHLRREVKSTAEEMVKSIFVILQESQKTVSANKL
jgi:hypothetical protein